MNRKRRCATNAAEKDENGYASKIYNIDLTLKLASSYGGASRGWSNTVVANNSAC
jgi:hypothetical protein